MKKTMIALSTIFIMFIGSITVKAQLSDADKAKRTQFWEDKWAKMRQSEMRSQNSSELDWKYADRGEIDGQSYKYLAELRNTDAIFFDPFLVDYLTQVLHKVVGPSPVIGRPGTINVLVIKNSVPNAFAMNNGTILVTTGMLSLVRTEAELRGLLAHEAAHVVLDHNLLNYSSSKSRQALVDFLTVTGAVLGGVAASKSAPGGMSRQYYQQYMTNAILGGGAFFHALASGVMDIIGAAYSRSQEEEADLMARDYLNAMGNDGLEYGDLLKRIGDFSRVRGLSQGSSLLNSHPEIKDRLEELEYKRPKTVQKSDTTLDKHLCECLVFNSSLAIVDRNYEAALQDLNRAIATGWAIEEAYLLKAIAVRHLDSRREATLEALSLLETANQRKTVGHRIVNSERALLHLRLGDPKNAMKALDSYIEQITQLKAEDVDDEIRWAKGMRAKCLLMSR